ncbi:Uncharacterised protein [Burkholderia pseudomallei]|nr:Uncharacterised protein [Burkholderia pseudomallei]CAJ4908550.1 Uncharacterised protein [Burkholderia pseudomallei]CAJ6387883.1 Uncharacterised protein [Burkholderia pseudomallei]CAJ6889005.1 Uncharacterised protein [Burkholderia pseudomallei]CAJ8303658.1 Uncharacterised protein [Burkholderia pseudomallei]
MQLPAKPHGGRQPTLSAGARALIGKDSAQPKNGYPQPYPQSRKRYPQPYFPAGFQPQFLPPARLCVKIARAVSSLRISVLLT